MFTYGFQSDSLFLLSDGIPQYEIQDNRIAFLVDVISRDSVILHKHGNLKDVQVYYDKIRRASSDYGTSLLLESLYIVTIEIKPEMVEEVNHCIVTSGYFPRMCRKFGVSFEC